MPFSDLFPRAVDDLVPVTVGRCVSVVDSVSHLQAPNHFVAGDAVPVVDDEVKSDALQEHAAARARHRRAAGLRQVENERLVERRIQRLLLDLSFLLADALPVVQQQHLDVRVCTAVIFSSSNIIFRLAVWLSGNALR